MPTTRHCAECGTPLPDDIPEKSCPVCVLLGALDLSGAPAEAVLTEKPGDLIGRYKLLEKIGEGGYGVVYMAEQAEPIRRRVALKVVKLGMDTKQVIARFEAERQALALMDHPNIARVFDAGATDAGRPYFVMELVRGIRITDYCDQHNLTTRERLELFMQVCHAVQHAHQKGIIHRDIKPSNILVTLHDGVAVPKVIDFGIAKATGQVLLTDKTVFTAFQQFIGTPAYMSPEQAELSGLDIDTRSDIYTLGVLLYELLTGRMPFEPGELLHAGFDEMRRLIREKEPLKPSTRLSSLSVADLTTVASRRQTEPPKLLHLVRGDLDWIVMKCLEKDRSRRYETANGLEHDLERHLKQEPVMAAAPSVVYQTSKFIRRHRVGLVMAGGMFLLLAAGALGVVWQAVRANQSRARAETALQETERQKWQAEAARREAETERDRAQKAQASAEAARQEAEQQKRRAEIARKDAELERDNAQTQRNRTERALKEADEARQGAANEAKRADAASAESRHQQAELEETMRFLLVDLSEKLRPIGRVDLLRTVTEKVLAHYQSMPAEGESDESLFRRFTAFKNLGQVLALQGEGTNALKAFQTSLGIAKEMSERHAGTNNWLAELCLCHQRIGDLWQARGDSATALDEFQQSLALAQRLAGGDPGNGLWQHHLLASYGRISDVFWAQGDKARARTNGLAAINLARELFQTCPTNYQWQRALSVAYTTGASMALAELGPDAAEEWSTNGLTLAEQLVALDERNVEWESALAASHNTRGDLWLARQKPEIALYHYTNALSIRRQMVLGDPSNLDYQRDHLRTYFKICRVLVDQGQRSKLGVFVHDGLAATADYLKTPVVLTRRFFSGKRQGVESLKTFDEAIKQVQVLAGRDERNTEWQHDLARSYALMGDMLLQAGKNKDALDRYDQALGISGHLVATDPKATGARYWLAIGHTSRAAALRRLSRPEEAAEEARQALRLFGNQASCWPGNAVFLEGPRVGKQDLVSSLPISYPQIKDAAIAFQGGFVKARKRAARESAAEKDRAEFASYCSEKALASLFRGDKAQTVADAMTAVDWWQKLSQAASNKATYRTNWMRSVVALGAFQLFYGQPQAAVATARRALELDPGKVEFKAILALGLAFDGQYEPARALLLENKSLQIGDHQTFPEAVLADLSRLGEKSYPKMDTQKIRKLLLPEPGKNDRPPPRASAAAEQ